MRSVSKQEFDAFLASTTTRSEPEAERDGEYAYETWLDLKGNAVASVAYRGGKAVSWMIIEPTVNHALEYRMREQRRRQIEGH